MKLLTLYLDELIDSYDVRFIKLWQYRIRYISIPTCTNARYP